MKTALITGINGQDGSYLAEFLLEQGYEVWGILRRNSNPESQTSRINHIFDRVNLVYGDLTDISSLTSAINQCEPDEIYNLGAQSHVRISFDMPHFTTNVTGLGTLNLLESVRQINPKIKMYQASSSEMFGNSIDSDGYQRETTPLVPVSPYGCSKVYSYNICNNYKNSYNMFISNGILFNHESPRRGLNFVTNKVVKAAIDIKQGRAESLPLGNLEATRDWGHAKDYVKAMWLILQHDTSDDFVCSTGISHTVRDLCEYVFSKFGMDYKDYVTEDEKFMRPEELDVLKGDCSKIKETLNWKQQYTFETMLDDMIEYWDIFYENK